LWFAVNDNLVNPGDLYRVTVATELPAALGFRNGATSVHTSRTMMLDELSLVMEQVGADASVADYRKAVTEDNIVGKATQTTRQRTVKRLEELYALDPACPVFRLLRHFWTADKSGRPMLAFLAAAARDPLLREATPWVLEFGQEDIVAPTAVAELLNRQFPSRFQGSTLLATAQRLASTWAQAGFLRGKVVKRRSRPNVTPASVAFALVLGYLCGLRGQLLLDCLWTRFLDRTHGEVVDLTIEASKQGWLRYKSAGAVVEITFPGLLTAREELASHEPD
jgi:hypothetical protein